MYLLADYFKLNMEVVNHLVVKMKVQVEVVEQSISHEAISRLLKLKSSNVFIGSIPVLELLLIFSKYVDKFIETADKKLASSDLNLVNQTKGCLEILYKEIVDYRNHSIRLHTTQF